MALPPIFIITLPIRKQRLVDHMKDKNLSYNIFPAYNGNQLGITSKHYHLIDHDAEYWSTHDPFMCGSGIHALTLSHLALIKYALMLDLPEIIIMEDDVELPIDFEAKYNQARLKLPDTYNFFYMQHCCNSSERLFDEPAGLWRGMPLCTACYLVSKSAMKKIDERSVLMHPVDIFYYHYITMQEPDKTYIAKPQLANQLSLNGQLPTTLS